MSEMVMMNPYVTIVAKKLRNLHKKLEKIVKADEQQKSGKVLNDEQLALLATRSVVEMKISELESIKVAMEEVVDNDVKTKEKEVDIAHAIAEEKAILVHDLDELQKKLENEESLRLNAQRKCQELEEEIKSIKEQTVPSINTADFQATLQMKINKLLKLFHVCARYPGAKLPPDVNFFGKCLMGETSISGFKETLIECTRKAELYLDDELSKQFEASRSMTYHDISVLMDELATELGGPPTPPPEPNSPMINFFTDTTDHMESLDINSAPVDLMVSLSSPTDRTDLSNQIIGEHIEAIISEEKTSLEAEIDTKKKDQKRPRRPRNKKDGNSNEAGGPSKDETKLDGAVVNEVKTIGKSTSSGSASKSGRPRGGRGGGGRAGGNDVGSGNKAGRGGQRSKGTEGGKGSGNTHNTNRKPATTNK